MGKRIGFGLIGNDKWKDKREEQRTRNLLKLNALPAGTATMTIKETNQIAQSSSRSTDRPGCGPKLGVRKYTLSIFQ